MPSATKRIRLSHKKQARQKCLFFTSSSIRKRVFVSTLATLTLKDFLSEQGLKIDEGEAYCDNFFLSEGFDIADIKIGKANIDARTIVNTKYSQLWIPKKPYEFGYVFDFYVAISLDTNKDRAEIVGWVSYDDIKDAIGTSSDKINYYVFDGSILRSPLELASAIIPISKAKKDLDKFTEEDHDVVQELFTGFLDNSLTTKELNFFRNHMQHCENCRETLLYLHLFDRKIKAPKEPMIYLDGSIPIEEAFVTPTQTDSYDEEYIPEEDIEEFEEDEEFEEIEETIQKFKEDIPYAAKTAPKSETIEAIKSIAKEEIKELSLDEIIAREEGTSIEIESDKLEDTETQGFIQQDIEEIEQFVQEAKVESEPFRSQIEEFTPGIIETGQEVDIQPEESFITDTPTSAWEASYSTPDTVFTEDAFGESGPSVSDVFASDDEALWQQYPTEGDIWHESFAAPETSEEEAEEFTISEMIQEPIMDTTPDTLPDVGISEEILSQPDISPVFESEEPEYIEPQELDEMSEEERLLAEAQAAEDYINAKLNAAGVEAQTYDEEEYHSDDSLTDYPEHEGSLTLESLEEEHFDTLVSDIDLESMEDSFNLQDPTIIAGTTETASGDDSLTIPDKEPSELSLPDTSDFEYISSYDDYHTDDIETFAAQQASEDATLEDLEKEFGSIASFNIEDLSTPLQHIQPAEDSKADDFSDFDSFIKGTENISRQDEPEEDTQSADLFNISSEMEGMFETPPTAEDVFGAASTLDEISEEDDYEEDDYEDEITLPPMDDSSYGDNITFAEQSGFTSQAAMEESTYISPPDFDDQIDQFSHEIYQGQYAPVDQSMDSSIPTDQDIAQLQEFVDTTKADAKKARKKAKKGGVKKFFLLTASLLLIGGVIAGVIVIAPKFGGFSDKLVASLPKIDFKNPLAKETANQQQVPASTTQPTEQTTTGEATQEEPEASTGDKLAQAPSQDTTLLNEVTNTQTATEEKLHIANKDNKAPSEAATDRARLEQNKQMPADIIASTKVESDQPTITKKSKAQPVNAPPAKPQSISKVSRAQGKLEKSDKDQKLLASLADEALPAQPEVKEPVILQTKKTIARENQKGESFLPENSKEGEGFVKAGYSASDDFKQNELASADIARASAPSNPVLSGLEEKEESIKMGFNPQDKEIAAIQYITSANVFWKPADSSIIDKELKTFISSSTQKAKTAINSELKSSQISGELRSTVISVKINNSTNSIISTLVSSSGSSRVDNLILNAVRKSFSGKFLPGSTTSSNTVQIKLTIAL
ncbi:MAG: DUF1822 family protein [Cyanobacteriota bacterium]